MYFFSKSTNHHDRESDGSGWATMNIAFVRSEKLLACTAAGRSLFNRSISLSLVGCVVFYNTWLAWTSH